MAASREVGLGLTDEVRRPVLRRSRRAQRLSFLGGVLGWAVSVWLAAPATGSTFSVWLILGGILLGGALGNLAAAPLDAWTSTPPDAPRIARGTGVTVRDYISPVERSFGWVATAAATAGAAICALAGVRDLGLLLGLPGGVAVLWLTGAAGTRYVISRPQHASSTLELAWSDALRAKNLRALLQAAPLAAVYGAIATLTAFDADGRQAGWQILVALLALLPPVAIVLLPAFRGARGARHYLHRLWPQTAAELDQQEHAAS